MILQSPVPDQVHTMENLPCVTSTKENGMNKEEAFEINASVVAFIIQHKCRGCFAEATF